MNIALCYECVLPERGGCETYISDLARRLVADGHEVHLYASRWDAGALPDALHYHKMPVATGPRFLKPWRFGKYCADALRSGNHHVSVGFDKTWGQDVLYPQGGLHSASAEHNLRKYPSRFVAGVARFVKAVDPAHWSFRAIERRQYLGATPPLIIVNSEMVRGHFAQHYQVSPASVRVVRSAIDPDRFAEHDRPRRRVEWRDRWNIKSDETVGLFVAMNYRLKGLEPLLHAVRLMPADRHFRLLVAGNPRNERFERLAQKLGISSCVQFLGPRRDMLNCYFAADFLVHPTFYDPCSLVVLEALACGMPIITSRFNGASELLQQGRDGFVIDNPHNHAELAGYMTKLLDPSIRSACARAARHTAAGWTFEEHYRQILGVFNEAAKRKKVA